MAISSNVLFSLLRTALGVNTLMPLHSEANWPEVYRLSASQTVTAIAFDGLQMLFDSHPECDCLNNLGVERYEWMANRMSVEQNYAWQKKVISSLAGLWHTNGVEVFALKGLAFGNYYPIPEHRYSGDFDFYTKYVAGWDQDGVPAWRKADSLIAEKGVVIDDSMSKHSKCVVDGLSLENHRHLIGIKGSRHWKTINNYLKELLERDSDESDIPGLFYPSWLFNALFCLIHARTHFLIEEGITLRQICDWAMIRKNGDAQRYAVEFQVAVDELGLYKFYSALNGVTDYVMGVKTLMTEDERMMLDDILSEKYVRRHKTLFGAHLDMVRQIWTNRWKFRLYSDASMAVVLGRYMIGYVFEKDYE